MNAQTEIPWFRRIWGTFFAAPFILRAFVAFAVVVTLADFIILPLASESFRARLVPYTGWTASMFYVFTIFFSFTLIYQPKRRKAVRFFGITLPLLLQVAFGVYQLSQMHRETFDNPYLIVNPWRAVWAILVPCYWITALYSSRMKRFCREA